MIEFELVLPAYNEALSLERVIRRTVAAAQSFSFSPDRFKLILVDNGSTDNSQEVLAKLQESNVGEWFRVVTVQRNQGYGHGLMRGLEATCAPLVGWSHADEQCDPKDAFNAYDFLTKAADNKLLIKGERLGRDRKDVWVSRAFEFLGYLILGLKTKEVNAQPKVFHRELLNSLKNPPQTFAFDLYVLFQAQKNGFSYKSIPVQFPKRKHGLSHWSSTFLGRYKTMIGMVQFMFRLALQEGRL
ncbi:MAG: Dodecaprenyl-phosphate galacturonate synthase [Elusimicrobia bacterium]|nr:Dodecaprenyl-phosphate galacturonate synthase [Elusimicrobiota bacterium]